MSQLFSNNVDTTLASALSDVATTATLTDGSALQSPTGGDFELLTLAALGNYEIVRITARATNSVTIVRGQEGTTAQSWVAGTRVFAGVTAGALTGILRNETTQAGSIATGGATSTATDTVSIGTGAATASIRSVAIGRNSETGGTWAVALGNQADAGANGAVAIGHIAPALGVASVAVGEGAYAVANYSVAAGWSAQADGINSMALGPYSYAVGEASVALGYLAETAADNVLSLSVLPAATSLPQAAASAAWRNVTAGAVITSNVLNLKNLQTYEIPIPTGVKFFPDEVGILITAADTVTVQPTVQFGINASTQEYLDAVATTGLAAVGDRQRFQTLKTAKGATTLRFEVTVVATATTLSGRIYWRGFAVED